MAHMSGSAGWLVRRLVDVALLRAGPQALPASDTLTALAGLVYALVGTVVLAPRMGVGRAGAESLLDAAMLAIFAWGLVRVRGWANRFRQTYTALAGTGALLSLLAWPLLLVAWRTEQLGGGVPVLVGFALLGLLAWTLLVIGHILRHALEVHLAVGTGLGLLYVIVSWRVMAALFPEAGA